MSETVYNLLRSDDILWAGDVTGTAQRITLRHFWARKLISSEAFARIFKPGHTYTLSYSGKVIELAPDTAFRADWFGVRLYSSADDGHLGVDTRVIYSNPPTGYTFRMSKTFTTSDAYPGDVQMLAYSDYSRDKSGAAHQGIVEIDDLMIVEGSTPAAWAPAEGETLTADEGGGAMTEPTNLVKTQPDESVVRTVAGATPATNNTRIGSFLDGTAHNSTTDYHIAITINPDAQIAAGATGLGIRYTDSSGAYNWTRSAYIASAIPANAWTRVEGTVTLPAGMTPYSVSIWWPSNATDMHFRACNLTVYPLTGGRRGRDPDGRWGGGGGMTEPTNLAKTQPDETTTYTVKANGGHKNFLRYAIVNVKLSATTSTSCHIGITIKPDKDIPSGHVWAWIGYHDDAGHENFAISSKISYVIPAGVWTRLERTVTVPAGMFVRESAISIDNLADETNFHATNYVVYPLTGGRIVRARGATAGYISKAKEATVLYTPSKSARQVRVILLDETGSSIYDIQSVAIVADAEELQGKVAAQESSIQTIQSDMTTVQSGLSGLNVRLASMQTELAGVSAGDVLYQVPYTVTDGKATFTAAVYKSGVECHTSYDPSCFTWYRKSEAGTVKIGTGYSVTVNVADVGYGGFVVGVFETQ